MPWIVRDHTGMESEPLASRREAERAVLTYAESQLGVYIVKVRSPRRWLVAVTLVVCTILVAAIASAHRSGSRTEGLGGPSPSDQRYYAVELNYEVLRKAG